jgi:hypothetical protein
MVLRFIGHWLLVIVCWSLFVIHLGGKVLHSPSYTLVHTMLSSVSHLCDKIAIYGKRFASQAGFLGPDSLE